MNYLKFQRTSFCILMDLDRKMYLLGIVIFLSIATKKINSLSQHYDSDKVLKFHIPDQITWNKVENITQHIIEPQDFDVWKFPSRNSDAYIRIQEKYLQSVMTKFQIENIGYDIYIDDVQRLINKNTMENAKLKETRKRLDIIGIFPRYDEVLLWMEEICEKYPEIATTDTIGFSTYGRPMLILKLGFVKENKWNVWMDAGLHAREWIAPSTALYIANQLIEGYVNNDTDVHRYLRTLDFNILPIANPDGYEFCHTDDRLWRKNRRPVTSECIGVDLNRNFGFQWGGVNADSNPCSNLYMGPYPESEREVVNIVSYILPKASKFIWYMAYHSWGQQFFTRWDYTNSEYPLDHEELLNLAQRTVNSINSVNGEIYEAGIAPDLMYPFSGSSSDWSRGVAQIKYPFLVELRDSNGDYGFVAPPEEIIPCGAENWAGAKVILTEIVTKYGDISPPD